MAKSSEGRAAKHSRYHPACLIKWGRSPRKAVASIFAGTTGAKACGNRNAGPWKNYTTSLRLARAEFGRNYIAGATPTFAGWSSVGGGRLFRYCSGF